MRLNEECGGRKIRARAAGKVIAAAEESLSRQESLAYSKGPDNNTGMPARAPILSRTLSWPAWGVAAMMLLLILGAAPANRIEAEDAYGYALAVERTPWRDLFHGHHLLYAPLCRAVFTVLHAMDPAQRAHPVLVAVSVANGLLSAAVFAFFLARRLRMPSSIAALGAGMLLATYGFWRYTLEAEIYVPACFWSIMAFYVASAPQPGYRRAAAAGLIAGSGVLIHIFNAIPAFAGIPLLLLLRGRWRHALLSGASAAIPVAALYTAVYGWHMTTNWMFHPIAGDTVCESGMGGSRIVKAAIGLGQSVVSGNFLFELQSLRQMIGRMFPYRMLAEENYMGMHAPPALRLLPFATLALLAVWAAVWGGAMIRRLRQARPLIPQGLAAESPLPLWAALACWFTLHAWLVVRVEPGNPEMWIMALPPLTALFCAAGLTTLDLSLAQRLAASLVVLLVLHNYGGGMRLLQDPNGDYNAQKARPVLAAAGKGDIVLTAENPVFVSYLRYWSEATIENMWNWSAEQTQVRYAALSSSGRRLFALADAFAPPPSMLKRFPSAAPGIVAFGLAIRNDFVPIATNEFGGLFLRAVPSPNPPP